MSIHSILDHGNDTLSTCSWNDMVHGMLHSITTNLSGASPACHKKVMTGKASFRLAELRGKVTKLGEGERQ